MPKLTLLVPPVMLFWGNSSRKRFIVSAIWALWEIGASGGADAKIIIALVLFFADGLLFIPIVLVGGVQGLAGLLAKRKTIPYTVAITLGTAAWLWLGVVR